MTNQHYFRIVAGTNDIIKAAKQLLKIAEELGPQDVDTSIVIAESVNIIADANTAIGKLLLDTDKSINLEKSFEKLKADVDTIPTNSSYKNIPAL